MVLHNENPSSSGLYVLQSWMVLKGKSMAALHPTCQTVSPYGVWTWGAGQWVPHSGLSSDSALNSIAVRQLHTMANVLRLQPLMKDQYSTGRPEEACVRFPLDSTALSEVYSYMQLLLFVTVTFPRCGVTSFQQALKTHDHTDQG